MNPQSTIDAAADCCLDHLHRETDLLEGCRDALAAVRLALRGGDGPQLLDAIERQHSNELRLASMSARRAELVGRLATTLGVPPQRATIGGLQMQLQNPRKRGQLRAARKRARSAARQVERLCRGNAALIAHRMDLIQRMIGALGSAAAPTYERQGRSSAAPQSTMQREC